MSLTTIGGAPIVGQTVNFVVTAGGGSVNPTSAVTDAAGDRPDHVHARPHVHRGADDHGLIGRRPERDVQRDLARHHRRLLPRVLQSLLAHAPPQPDELVRSRSASRRRHRPVPTSALPGGASGRASSRRSRDSAASMGSACSVRPIPPTRPGVRPDLEHHDPAAAADGRHRPSSSRPTRSTRRSCPPPAPT